MAYRPHTTKLPTGQVTFAYMPQEKAEEYEKVLLNYEKSKAGSSNVDGGFFPAIGMFKNSTTKKFELVIIKYNPFTKESLIESSEEVAEMRKYADSRFKLKLLELKII